MRAQGKSDPPCHMWLSTTVSTTLSVAFLNGASIEGSRSFTLPTFALSWVR